MDVHYQISKHSDKQHKIVNEFLFWDQERERYIAEAVDAVQNGKEFSVEQINEVTERINKLAALNGITPSRKHVTEEMVLEHAKKR
ncbi:DUF2533 family protein [Fictibacillus aquaticus]|uniref:DUF2533 domain-containing protein n=1 Tax=Fictibacillus aquaticus TaxID=2021314 RepID=A0A235FBR5_9BACL|nr:DUF2533 family protein [Fictibacillus aquaticus]OYD58721.1 hypothetical protein CGZ90_02130 [Fictibacillus aquaticus]